MAQEIWNWDIVNDNNSPQEGNMPGGLVSDNFREVKGAVAREQKSIYPINLTTGTATAYVLADDRDISTGYIDGMLVSCRLHVANGDDPTININAQGAKKILHSDARAVKSGELSGIQIFTYVASGDGGNGAFAVVSGVVFGTASHLDVGTGVGNVVQLVDIGGGTAGLPAVDGSQLTGLRSTITGQTLRGMLGPAASHPQNTAGLWIDCLGTIGNATSGATYANANAQTLFEHIWGITADAECPVSGGRGASANADWTANKTLTLPDYRGKPGVQMGGVAAGVIGSQVPNQTKADVRGGQFGNSVHTLVKAEQAPLTISSNTTRYGQNRLSPGGVFLPCSGSVSFSETVSKDTDGGSGAHNNTQASIAEDVWIAL